MSRPRLYLVRMILFLAAVLAVCAMLFVPLRDAFLANGPLNGFDALLATVQMPKGIPVATVGINRADNAALLTLQILAGSDSALAEQLKEHRRRQQSAVAETDRSLSEEL